MSYQAGDRLGSYEILEKIGSGGMGDVYKARDVRLERSVAIKVLAGEAVNLDHPTRRERLQREAKAVSKLNHPNICSLFDVGEQDGAYYLVLEHIEGKTLLDELTQRSLSVRDAIRIGVEVADGLAAAHRAGIVHRDLKPGNIMLTRTGAKILDFGLARFAASESLEHDDEDTPTVSRALTSKGVVVGTPWYMAPEQVMGETVDARTDIFALGIVLYETIAGQRPFDGDAPSKVTASILKHDPPRLDGSVSGCPPRVGQLVEACLAKDRDARWQSASDLARELRWSMATDGEWSRVQIPPRPWRRRAQRYLLRGLQPFHVEEESEAHDNQRGDRGTESETRSEHRHSQEDDPAHRQRSRENGPPRPDFPAAVGQQHEDQKEQGVAGAESGCRAATRFQGGFDVLSTGSELRELDAFDAADDVVFGEVGDANRCKRGEKR